MIITAKQSYVRCGEQKLRDVARAIKGLSVTETKSQLVKLNKEPAKRILETLNQAVANANHNFGIGEDKLAFAEMLILRGPHYKRFRAVSRGQGHSILKRTAHIVIKLKSLDENAVKVAAKAEEKIEEAQEEVAVEKKVVAKKPAAKTVKPPARSATHNVAGGKKETVQKA
jgi:large subunit ribosomal protein L22